MHSNKKTLPPLNALRVFEAAARHSSFKLAAEEIFVTQSAVSRQIQVLEEYYGTPLFIRKTRKVELTSEGRILFQATSQALDCIGAASHEVFVKQKRGYLTIASTITFSTLWLMPRMQNLRDCYPDIQLHLMTCEASPKLHDAFDIAITLGHEETPGFDATPLFEEETFPVCTPEFLAQHPELKSIDGLFQVPLLELNRNHWKYKRWTPINWERWFQANGIENRAHNTVMSFNHFPLVMDAARKHMGVALGWAHLVSHDLEQNRLIRPISDSYVLKDRKHYLIVREELKDTSEVKQFKSWLISQIKLSGIS
ncbi:LysR substrate-binding domain-containing protein [Zobellella aerophila]|uniref:LysR family transcriptional regulator n=1 Tax=Zobellella aerophila TaxID=870480 RepID=A0ABP6WF04_9GAMM